MYVHASSRQLFVEKHGASISLKVPSFEGTLMWQSAEVEEKSSIVYLHIIAYFTYRKNVTLLALNKLESLFIKTKQLTHIVVSGDFKVYKLLCEIKKDYGKEVDWLLPYLEDMYILINYLAWVLGRHWHVGVKEVMGEVYKNKTLEKIKKSDHYTHTANAMMLFSEACVRLFVEPFMSSASSPTVDAIKICLTEGTNGLAKNDDK